MEKKAIDERRGGAKNWANRPDRPVCSGRLTSHGPDREHVFPTSSSTTRSRRIGRHRRDGRRLGNRNRHAHDLDRGGVLDHIRKRKIFIVVGYLLWGLSTMASPGSTRSTWSGSLGLNAVRFAIVLVIVMDCIMTFFGSTANDAAFNAWVTDVTVPQTAAVCVYCPSCHSFPC